MVRTARRWVPVAALAAALALLTPALSASAADAPTPGDTAQAQSRVDAAQLDLRQAQAKVRTATALTEQLTSQVVELSAQQSRTAVALAAARTDARIAVRAAYNDALIDPAANLLANLGGSDPDLADQVRRRRLADAAALAGRLQEQSGTLERIGTQLADRRQRAVQAAAEAVGAAAQAQRDLDAAQRTERDVRRKVELAAQQRELAQLNDSLLKSLEAAYVPPASSSGSEQMTPDSPAQLLGLYQRAATTCPGLPWGVLAAIGQVETDHGRNKAVSSAGAMGPMQFLPSSWAVYGVDGDGDGKADILDQADAVFSAAHLLCTDGGGNPATLYRAIYAYNHSDFYVNTVLGLAAKYAQTGQIQY